MTSEDEGEGVELDQEELEHREQFEKEQQEADEITDARWYVDN